jgi:hypothetical protein
MPVTCPNPHCNHTAVITPGALKGFSIQTRDEDVYRCGVYGRAQVVNAGKPAPTCSDQPAGLIGNRSRDVARGPKCREFSLLKAGLSGFAGAYVGFAERQSP